MTGASVDAVRQALERAEGRIEQALSLLKERGAVVAAKKADRETGEGIISSYIHELAMHIAAADPQSVEELLYQAYIRDEDTTVEELIKNYIAKMGENIKIGEFCRFEIRK